MENRPASKWGMAWKEATWVFGLSRFVIILVSYVTVSCFGISTAFLPQNIITQASLFGLGKLWYAWWRWDVVHYVTVAHDGYQNAFHIAFFPFYPILMHLLGTLGGGSLFADYIAGLILANLCFLGALVLFHRLISQDFDQIVARNALFFLAFSPYGIFFFAGYTEPLFLLLSLATFLFLRRGSPLDWVLAGLCGFLASLTRSTGIVLTIPFLLLFVQKFGWHPFSSYKQLFEKLNAVYAMLLVPAGLLIYMLYLRTNFGNPFIYTQVQAQYWQRSFALPWVGIINNMRSLKIPLYQTENNVADLIFTLIPLIVFVFGCWRISRKYNFYTCGLIFMALSFPHMLPDKPLMSAPRLLMIAFPISLILAIWSKKYPKITIILITLFLTFFVLNTVLFVTESWVA